MYERGPRGWLLGAWAGNSKKQGSDAEVLAKGSEEKAPDVFPTLTLTFESVIGSLAILRSNCGDIWGWCEAEYFYLPAVSFLSMSPWTYKIHLLSWYCYQTSYLHSKWGQKRREEKGNWFVCFSHFLGNTLRFYSGMTVKETPPVIRSVRRWLCYTRYLGK